MPEPSTSRPTMAQVAASAGVSVMTVSYVYGRPDRVAVSTRERVLAVAATLGYPGPHPGARSLRRRRTGVLGVVMGEPLTYAFDDPQATTFLAGVASVCTERDLGLVLVPVTGGPADPDRVRRASVDAFVVWTTADDDPVLDAVLGTGLPVAIHGGPARAGATLIAADDRTAARAVGLQVFTGADRPCVLSFPLDRSRRQLVQHGIDPDRAAFPVTRNRLLGLRDACHELAVRWEDVAVAVCSRNDSQEAQSLSHELLGATAAPDALAAMSDQLALGALRAAATLGVAVPESLAVSGWDDAAGAGPAGLSTVRQDLRDQGARCARSVLAGKAPESAPSWSLVVRATTRSMRR